MTCKETQTEAGLNLKRDEFNFDGDNDRELGWHMERNHWWPGDQKAETESMNISMKKVKGKNQKYNFFLFSPKKF